MEHQITYIFQSHKQTISTYSQKKLDYKDCYDIAQKLFNKEIHDHHFDLLFDTNLINNKFLQLHQKTAIKLNLHAYEEKKKENFFHLHIEYETNPNDSFVKAIFIDKSKSFEHELQNHLPKCHPYILYLESPVDHNKILCSASDIKNELNKHTNFPLLISYTLISNPPPVSIPSNPLAKFDDLAKQLVLVMSVVQDLQKQNQNLSSKFEERMNDFSKLTINAFEERIQSLDQKIVSVDGKLGQIIASQAIFKSDYVGGINKEKPQEYPSLPQYGGRNFERSELGNQNPKPQNDDDDKGFQNNFNKDPENDSLFENLEILRKMGGNEVGKGLQESLEASDSLFKNLEKLEQMGGNELLKDLQDSITQNRDKNLLVTEYPSNVVIENTNISKEMERCSNNQVEEKKENSTNSKIENSDYGNLNHPPIVINKCISVEMGNPDLSLFIPGLESSVVIENSPKFLEEANGQPSKMENSQVIGINTHDFNVDDVIVQIKLLLMNNFTHYILIYNIIDDMDVVLTLISNGTEYFRLLKLDKNYKKFECREDLPINFDIRKFEIQLQYSNKTWTKMVNG